MPRGRSGTKHLSFNSTVTLFSEEFKWLYNTSCIQAYPASKFCLSFSLRGFFCTGSYRMKGVSAFLEAFFLLLKVLWSSKFCSLSVELEKIQDEVSSLSMKRKEKKKFKYRKKIKSVLELLFLSLKRRYSYVLIQVLLKSCSGTDPVKSV